MGVTVDAPDGRTWVVSRSIRWPHRRFDTGLDVPDVGFMDVGDALAWILVAIFAAILIVVLLPLVILVVEGFAVVIGSMLFRRAWAVTAWTSGPPPERREWRVRGLLRTRAAVREVADELRRGVKAAPEHAEVAR